MSLRRLIAPVLTVVLIVSAGLVSCTKASTAAEEPEAAIVLKKSTGGSSAGETFINVVASSAWSLSIVQDSEWASLDRESGEGNCAGIVFSWSANAGEERSCEIVLETSSRRTSATFTQESGIEKKEPGVLTPDPVASWMELPEVPQGLYFFTHPMEIDGKTLRNYSFAWNATALVAEWVAYPLNSRLLSGSSGRTEAWGLDPKLPEEYQPVLYRAYSGGGYARGHQLPSADRQIAQYNAETFYGTNMTPQNYTFNSGTWLGCENYVRDRCRSFDTLYVVTGCVVEGSTSTSKDNYGKEVTVPVAYFKALLGYKSSGGVGICSTTGGYTGMAFYYNNEPNTANCLTGALTLSELEQKTGLNFFVNLPSAIGPTLSQKVKTTKDTWWYN